MLIITHTSSRSTIRRQNRANDFESTGNFAIDASSMNLDRTPLRNLNTQSDECTVHVYVGKTSNLIRREWSAQFSTKGTSYCSIFHDDRCMLYVSNLRRLCNLTEYEKKALEVALLISRCVKHVEFHRRS